MSSSNVYLKNNTDTIGVDEVGRGTLFGNVVAAAVILPETFNDDIYLQIKDSKKLSFKKRAFLANYIKTNAITYGIGYVSPEEIDNINILQAAVKAMHMALYEAMKKKKFTKIIVDGNYFKPILPIEEDDDPIEYECVIKADTKYLNVAAASIIAKDYHDNEILKLIENDKKLDKYDLKNNMGYATLKHREAIKQYGIHHLHRKSFSTCANYLSFGD